MDSLTMIGCLIASIAIFKGVYLSFKDKQAKNIGESGVYKRVKNAETIAGLNTLH